MTGHHLHARPPGPRGVPILGMLPAVRRDPAGVFMHAAQRYGDVVYFKIANRHGYLITNPADVRHVLQDNARNYHKSPLYEKLRSFLGNGLLTSEGEFWLRQRRIAQPAFHRQRVADLAGVMAQLARDAAAQIERLAADGRPVDVEEQMMRLTRTVVLRALLGADLGPYAARSTRPGRRSINTSARASGRWGWPTGCPPRRSGASTPRAKSFATPSIT